MTTLLLDIPTIYVLTGFSSLAGAAILVWLRGDHRDSGPAITLCAGGILALGIGFLSFAWREELFQWFAPTVGYAGFGIAAALVWIGTAHLLGAPTHPLVAGLAIVLYLAALAGLHEPTAQRAMIRIVLSSTFVMLLLGLAALQAHRSPWSRTLRSVRLMRGLLILFATIIGLRMLLFVASGIPLQTDGTSPPGVLRMIFAVIFGAMPFAITVAVLGISNSQLSARLRQMATTDDLTGLVSRRSLDDSGQRLLDRRSEGGCIALMMIDLDNFKSVNDRFGHSTGDAVLRHVAGVLRLCLRPDSLIVRYGGDEFCALVPVPGEAAAFVVAERLRAAMEASPHLHDGKRLSITMSIGVTVHRRGVTLEQLLDEADRRAYRAKSQGRNRVVADDQLAAA